MSSMPSGLSTARTFKTSSVAFTPPARILIVDDNASKRVALRAAVTPLGHPIVEADSGIAALRCVMKDDFAIILMDVQMPGMDGFETAQLIRQRSQSKLTPIVYITNYSKEEIDQVDHYAQGAVDFIIFPPLSTLELRSKVSFFVHRFLDAQRLAAQAAEVRASVAQLQALTDSAPIGIFQTDSECRYVYTNPRWSEITGVPAELAVGRPWDSVMEPEGARPDPDLLNQGGLTHSFEVVGSEGPRIAVITMQSMPDSDGAPAGWVGTLADTTAQTQANHALFDARDAALLASSMQRNFAASASHELRTPTASIVGYLEEVLLSDTINEEDRGLLEVAYRNSQRLSMLIDDLMLLDQWEIGAPTMNLEPTPLIPVAERVHLTLATAAADGGIEMRRAYDEAAPPALADPARLEQALMNLVSNAIKFTPSGGSVTVAVGAGDDNQAVLSVIDTGMGIEPADCARIFERFYRSRSVTDGAIAGSGLGLAIAKVMVEAQAGSIAVTSQSGQGSTFSVTLPAAVEDQLSSVSQPVVAARE